MKPLAHLFALVPDCHVPHGYYHDLWTRHFYDGLRPLLDRLVTPVDLDFRWARDDRPTDAGLLQQARETASARLWDQILAAHRVRRLDAVLSYCFARDLDLGLVRRTRELGIPWINFFCDSTHRFGEVEALAREASLNWFPESAAESRYRALGVPFMRQPYALNPAHLPDLTGIAPVRDVAFIGLPTANRITQLGGLRLLGCPVTIRGHGWVGAAADPFASPLPRSARLGRALLRRGRTEKLLRRLLWPLVRQQAMGPLEDAAFPAFVRESRILLGLNQGRDEQGRLASYLKFRDIEFPGYGCCYLTEHNADIADAFAVGTEVLTYRTLPEAAAQIRRLRREPERALAIGRAARQRVMTAHTWAVRLRQLAERL